MREAGEKLRIGFQSPADKLSKRDFINAWSSIAYLFPGLHPDGFDDPDSGWTDGNFLKDVGRRTSGKSGENRS